MNMCNQCEMLPTQLLNTQNRPIDSSKPVFKAKHIPSVLRAKENQKCGSHEYAA